MSHRIDLASQIDQWRSHLQRHGVFDGPDLQELEGQLRGQLSELVQIGLSEEEAFLIAVKRLGRIDTRSREFARTHASRLWTQLVLDPDAGETSEEAVHSEFFIVVALAVAAALAIKVPALFGLQLDDDGPDNAANGAFYLRNLSLFVLPFLVGYLAWKRRWVSGLRWLLPPFAIAAALVNLYPFSAGGSTEILTMIHLPIALWLLVAIAHAGGEWNASGRRMDFVRFSGELAIYYVLIALGGGVFIAFTLLMFGFIGYDEAAGQFANLWILPCGALGAVIVASWLVEAKQSALANMAPVLTRLFTPLFVLLLLAFLATMLWTRTGLHVDREMLIGFDLLLVLVLGLLLYAVSARDPQAPPGVFDGLQLVLVISALVVDMLALVAITGRISEFGFSANRIAALGENLILLVNLGWSAWLYYRFVRGRQSFLALERWQTAYLPVYALWAAVVVVLFPPVFGYL